MLTLNNAMQNLRPKNLLNNDRLTTNEKIIFALSAVSLLCNHTNIIPENISQPAAPVITILKYAAILLEVVERLSNGHKPIPFFKK
jgi:hypothetical protein